MVVEKYEFRRQRRASRAFDHSVLVTKKGDGQVGFDVVMVKL